MKPETIPGFDCLEFKWKVQSEIYEKIKNMTNEEQIAYFRHAAETGPFARFLKTLTGNRQGDATRESAENPESPDREA